VESRATSNFALYASVWSLPGARDLMEQHLEAAKRRGDIASVVVTTDNLSEHYIKLGEWGRAQTVVEELLERDLGEFDIALLSGPLVMLALLRGDLETARLQLPGFSPLEGADDPWDRFQRQAYYVMLAAAEGKHEEAVTQGLDLIDSAVKLLGGASYTPDWEAWPSVLDSALALGDLEAADGLIATLERRPPGHMPPQYRAHLARAQGLVAAARAEDESAEAHLRKAIGRFEEMGFAYWHAATEVDLAALLIEQERGDEAAPLLEHAISVLDPLRALPVLNRAYELVEDPTALDPSAGQRAG